MLECLTGLEFGQGPFMEGAQHHQKRIGFEVFTFHSHPTSASSEIPQHPFALRFRLWAASGYRDAVAVTVFTPGSCRQLGGKAGIGHLIAMCLHHQLTQLGPLLATGEHMQPRSF